MADAIGKQTVFMLGEETTYGVAVTPTRAVPISEEGIERKNRYVEDPDMFPGGFQARRSQQRELSGQDVEGDFSLSARTKGLGLLLKHIFGAVVTAQQGGTPAYKHTFTPALVGGKSLTIQKQIRDNTGAAKVSFDALGCKITKATFSVSPDSALRVTCSVNGRELVKNATPPAASYGTGRMFQFRGAALRVAGQAVTDTVSETALTVERPLDTEAYGQGNQGLKDEPAENDDLMLSGKFTSRLKNIATFYDPFAADTPLELVWEFVGATISGSIKELLRFTIPEIRLEGDTPKTSGKDVISMDIPFIGMHNGTQDSITVEYITVDTAP